MLETYLRSILTTKDARFRQSYTFLDFLAVPSQSRSGPSTASSTPDHWTSQNWLGEHNEIQSMLRSTRSALLKRDALALQMGDSAGARSAGVGARKLLKDGGTRLEGLEKGLGELKLSDGEKARRDEMVEVLRAERGNLVRMADAGVRTNRSPQPPASMRGESPASASASASAQLFERSMPGAYAPGRVFGQKPPPQETDVTRPLDDRGLVQLQQEHVKEQDDQLGELSKVLIRQRQMGEEIGREIGEQTEMLEGIEGDVGRVGGKMARAKREMNRLG